MEAIKGTGKQDIVAICGVGNNGGDGFAVARLAHIHGHKVKVALVGALESMTHDAKIMFQSIEKLGIPWKLIKDIDELDSLAKVTEDTVILDALFGIGCTRPLKGIFEDAVQWINRHECRTIAVDVPSGIHSDHGHVMGVAVKAHENRPPLLCQNRDCCLMKAETIVEVLKWWILVFRLKSLRIKNLLMNL